MKLISCYIENFGNISNKSFDFSGNLICVCEKNGFGKTTLAAFIKAMFYGLPASRSNSKDFDDRQHYYPFNGGKFGGNLTFESGGKQYKIQRFFDKKSAVKDETALYSGGNLTEAPECIGKEVFGLDEASFMRTVFIDSSDNISGVTGGISAKLNNFVDDTKEGNNFDSAMNMLERKQKEYKAARGGGGKINGCEERINALRARIRNLKDINDGLGKKYTERESIAADIYAVEDKLKRASGQNAALERWNAYERMLEDAAAAENEFLKLKEKYPCGLPDGEEIKALNEKLTQITVNRAKLESSLFSAQKAERLKELENVFKDGVPAEEVFDECQTDITKAADTVTGEPVTLKALPPEADVEEMRKKTDELKAHRERLNSSALHSAGTQAKSNYKIPAILLILAGILIVAGGSVMFVQLIAGIAVLVVGLCLAGVSGFFYVNEKLKGISKPVQNGGEQIALQNEISALENSIKSFLAGYGYVSDNVAEVDFNNFLRDIAVFEKNEENAAKREFYVNKVKSFLGGYGVESDNLQKGLNALKAQADEYSALLREQRICENNAAECKRAISICESTACDILNKYSLFCEANSEAVKKLEADLREYSRLNAERNRLAGKAQGYKEENKLTEKPQGERVDTDFLSVRLRELNNRLAVIDKEIGGDEAQTEKLPDLLNELNNEEENLKEFKEKYALLGTAAKFLKKAEQNLKDRYVAPVKEKFVYYSAALEKALGEKVVMDKNFNVRYERGGEEKSDRHLSAGQYSLCSLCLRLALIDNMYAKEPPFIIMDDPFINLDKEHMQNAARLIKELSAGKQLIYFCCHESRII